LFELPIYNGNIPGPVLFFLIPKPVDIREFSAKCLGNLFVIVPYFFDLVASLREYSLDCFLAIIFTFESSLFGSYYIMVEHIKLFYQNVL